MTRTGLMLVVFLGAAAPVLGETVETSALALPLHTRDDYRILKDFLEKRFPGYAIVFVNKDETLLNERAEKTPFIYRGLRMWSVKRSV